MGCTASSTANAAISSHKAPPSVGVISKADTASISSRNLNTHGSNTSSPQTKKKRDWAVRPGYSSGASSEFSGSEKGDDENEANSDPSMGKHRSQASGLALENLRQEICGTGGLTEAVVRIATPFGKPIEEIYDGVHDGKVLGSGVSGVVRLVIHKATGLKYAVKVLDFGMIDSAEGLKQMRDEIFIMCQLDHPNIVRIEEVYESSNEIYIVQELCTGGDLFDRLDEQSDYHYTEAACAKLVKQMISSVRYLHSRAIVHRDLKLENFLFSSRGPNAVLKIIDFGLSKHFEMGEAMTVRVGTPYTVAPEIIRGRYDEKCDLWAIGVITYLLLSGETPFGGLDGENMMKVKQCILRAQVSFQPVALWEQVSSEGKQFVKRLLHADPKQRPTAREAQLDPWIQIWAKKDVTEGAQLNDHTVTALLAFKEYSDMQKILAEVLSFTLSPDQIVDLRAEFEKIDTDADGEISFESFKQVLMSNAEAGSLGALTEQEIEGVFDAIRIRKSDPTIRWHEFLAAGLSQAKLDDRNLRLAFDRLDSERKGYVSFEDLHDLLGNIKKFESLQEIWSDSLNACSSRMNRITFDDFKRLVKGQAIEPIPTIKSEPAILTLETLDEEEPLTTSISLANVGAAAELGNLDSNPNVIRVRDTTSRKRTMSHTPQSTMWGSLHEGLDAATNTEREPVRPLFLPNLEDVVRDGQSSIMTNRALYRKNREVRMSVIEASKMFDMKRTDRRQSSNDDLTTATRDGGFTGANLIMRRGSQTPIDTLDSHQRALFESAARRCGRTRREKNMTKSDVTGMLLATNAYDS